MSIGSRIGDISKLYLPSLELLEFIYYEKLDTISEEFVQRHRNLTHLKVNTVHGYQIHERLPRLTDKFPQLIEITLVNSELGRKLLYNYST